MVKFLSVMALAGALCFSSAFAADKAADKAKADDKAAVAEINDETEVSIIAGNKTYHLPTCAQIKKAQKGKKKIETMTVAKAKEAKLAACKSCIDKTAKAQKAAKK